MHYLRVDSDHRELTSPPVDFPVHGLGWGFRGARWVDFFEAMPGTPSWALWLGHREYDSDNGVRVGSLPKRRYEETMCPNGGDPLAKVAFSAAFGLVNLTLPDGSVPRPDGLIESLVEHAEKQANRYEHWPTTFWQVDGKPVPARMWRFAGAWAGFTEALSETYVVVIGLGVEPDDLRLMRITKPDSYGANFAAALNLVELGRQKSSRPEAWLPPPRRGEFHADQLALMPSAESQ